ncbi:MAG: histone deacetylase family protein [Nevskiaceae bacterium]|nr:MAG: histone deacetylase family protein [Nevskiaceae bacterium]
MKSYRPVAWITHPACALHDMGADHPESPRRLAAIEDRLLVAGLKDFLLQCEAPRAPEESLARVHDAGHVRRILDADTREGEVQIDGDTLMNRHSHEAALRAAGAGLLAVDLVMSDRAGLAFCAVRPPGHHAERARAMGFCLFNNIAVAAAHALARGLTRVAILDFDLHYGNGTADIFKSDRRVLLCSTYQHPLYPHWAGIPGADNLLDVPLPAGTGSREFRAAVADRWLPALERFQPELLLVSAGFDAHMADPLGDLCLSTDDYRWLGTVIQGVADACCQGRVVAMLEGGYELHALARSVEAFLTPFVGELPV